MIFQDRYAAGEMLAKKISALKLNPKNTVVAAIPRGGVVVGKAISQSLKFPLTAIVVKKIPAPQNPELAIGAVGAAGKPSLDLWLIRDLKIERVYLKAQIAKKREEAQLREKYLGISKQNFTNKNVIVVDDGLATGQSAKAAARIIRSTSPKSLILAVPCASPTTIETVKEDFDEIVVVAESEDFWAVGQFYEDFRPVTDEEVKEILNNES